MDEDEQIATEEQNAPLEPPDAVVVASDEISEVPDPFFGFYQNSATITVGEWAGLPNYECSACAYSHLDQARVEAHLSIHGQTFTQGERP